MKSTKVEVSAIITKVDNNPSEVTFFTRDGQKVPNNRKVTQEKTEAGTKFYIAPQT